MQIDITINKGRGYVPADGTIAKSGKLKTGFTAVIDSNTYVIAETFARIFYRNAINIGLPIIECPDAAKEIEAGDELEVNFDTGVITDKTKGTSYQGQAFPPFMQKIIDCEGLVNYINQK